MSEEKVKDPVRGACLCGAVQYEITLPTSTCAHCHCTMCQRANSAGYVTWVILPSTQLRMISGLDKLTRYQSSDHAARKFCSVCGSHLFGESTRTPGLAYLFLANLQGEIDRAPEFHSSFSARAPWIEVPEDGLPRLEDAGLLETQNA
jgi:hypothetical protein